MSIRDVQQKITSQIFGIVNQEKLLASAIPEKIQVRNTFCAFNKK